MIRKMNDYFFGEEEICLSDALWFYGIPAFTLLIMLTVVLPAKIQLWMVG